MKYKIGDRVTTKAGRTPKAGRYSEEYFSQIKHYNSRPPMTVTKPVSKYFASEGLVYCTYDTPYANTRGKSIKRCHYFEGDITKL